jgi:hypothetical protein
MKLTDYDPAEVNVTLGPASISGFAAGTFIIISKNVDTWSEESGIAGDGMRIKNNDAFYTITLTLMANSDSNDALAAISEADKKLTGSGLVPMKIKNNLGRETFACPSVWVKKISDVEFSDGTSAKSWVLGAHNAVYWPGGHSR